MVAVFNATVKFFKGLHESLVLSSSVNIHLSINIKLLFQ